MIPPLEVAYSLRITAVDQALARDLRPLGQKRRRACIIEHLAAAHCGPERRSHGRDTGVTRLREARELGGRERNADAGLEEQRTLTVVGILTNSPLRRCPPRIAIEPEEGMTTRLVFFSITSVDNCRTSMSPPRVWARRLSNLREARSAQRSA
jgi:hypothetical protein